MINPKTINSASNLIDRIIECAGKHFEQFGFRRTTVDGIALELHISKRTLYTLFPSKDAILQEVAWRDTKEIINEFNDSLPEGIHAERILLDLCRYIFTDRLKRGSTGRFQRLFGADPGLAAAYRAALTRVFASLYREGMARGALKPINPDMAAEHIMAMVLGASSKFHLFPKPAAVFTETLSMIADAVAWKDRIPLDSTR
jgi:TetR/AcrR family transcriptional regulator